jgi:hypothetical protein
MMSNGTIGALIGLAFGVADFVLLTVVSSRPQMPERNKPVLNIVRYIGLVVFPVAGWFIGPQIAGG